MIIFSWTSFDLLFDLVTKNEVTTWKHAPKTQSTRCDRANHYDPRHECMFWERLELVLQPSEDCWQSLNGQPSLWQGTSKNARKHLKATLRAGEQKPTTKYDSTYRVMCVLLKCTVIYADTFLKWITHDVWLRTLVGGNNSEKWITSVQGFTRMWRDAKVSEYFDMDLDTWGKCATALKQARTLTGWCMVCD